MFKRGDKWILMLIVLICAIFVCFLITACSNNDIAAVSSDEEKRQAALVPTPGVDPDTLVPLHIGYHKNYGSSLVIIAEQQGFFKDVGLEVTVTPYGSQDMLRSDLEDGLVDTACLNIQLAVQMLRKDYQMIIYAGHGGATEDRVNLSGVQNGLLYNYNGKFLADAQHLVDHRASYEALTTALILAYDYIVNNQAAAQKAIDKVIPEVATKGGFIIPSPDPMLRESYQIFESLQNQNYLDKSLTVEQVSNNQIYQAALEKAGEILKKNAVWQQLDEDING